MSTECCSAAKPRTTHGENFSALYAGKFSDLHRYEVKHPRVSKPVPGKLFLKDYLGLTGMQVSFGIMPPHSAVPFSHQHRDNEELYIFTSGKGQIQIDGNILDVEEGTAVRIAPNGLRTWRNNSDTEMHYIVIQAKLNSLGTETFEDGIPGAKPPKWD